MLVTLKSDPTPMTEQQFWTRARKMRETWGQLTPTQQARWGELKTDIEQMSATLHWLKGFCDELATPEPVVTEARQLEMEGTK